MGAKAVVKAMDYSIPCPDVEERRDNSTRVYRKRICEDELIDNFDPPFTTVYEIFKTAAERYPGNKCLGEKLETEEGWTYKWISYREVDRLVT